MAYQFPHDVDERVKALMATGEYLTEDDVLRDAIEALKLHRDDLAAIQAGIDDLEAGRVRPIREVDSQIRERHGFHK